MDQTEEFLLLKNHTVQTHREKKLFFDIVTSERMIGQNVDCAAPSTYFNHFVGDLQGWFPTHFISVTCLCRPNRCRSCAHMHTEDYEEDYEARSSRSKNGHFSLLQNASLDHIAEKTDAYFTFPICVHFEILV